MVKQPKLSIIIPVYNKEAYLAETLDSVLAQTFKDSEILIINDGSTDRSYEICKSYQEKCDRIKIINQKNGGASAARNVGIENAVGQYIIMLDADDTIDSQMHEKMIAVMDELEVDISVCGHKTITNGKTVAFKHTYPSNCKLDREYLEHEIIPNSIGIKDEGSAIYAHWAVMIKRNLVIANEIRYNQKYKKEEDKPFIITCLKYASSIAFLDECLYNYIKREDSLIHTYSKRFNNILGTFSLYESLFGNMYDFNNEYRIKYNISMLEDCIVNVLVHRNDVSNVKKEVMEIIANPISSKWFEKLGGGEKLHMQIKTAYKRNDIEKIYRLYMRKFLPLRVKLIIRRVIKGK